MSPKPPLLFVCSGKSFWVQDAPLERIECTTDAFKEGVYSGALVLDASGQVWNVERAELGKAPNTLDKLLPWRKIPVSLEVEPVSDKSAEDIAAELKSVLDAECEFTSQLGVTAEIIRENIRQADTAEQIIMAAAPAKA